MKLISPAAAVVRRNQLQVITDEHLRHLVAMETDEPDSAVEVDQMLAELNQFQRLSSVSRVLPLFYLHFLQRM